jgi:hypothetical protein
MKKLLFVLMAGVTLTALSGCCAHRGCGPFGGCGLLGGSCGQCSDCPDTCQSCDDGNGAPCQGGACAGGCGLRGAPAVDAGPPTAAVTYPYYTTRGPRDFLARNPRSIGP